MLAKYLDDPFILIEFDEISDDKLRQDDWLG